MGEYGAIRRFECYKLIQKKLIEEEILGGNAPNYAEFKLNGSAEEALHQIDEKGYMEPYAADPREKVKVGVSFSKEKRNIDRFILA